jgi:acyl carrier protein
MPTDMEESLRHYITTQIIKRSNYQLGWEEPLISSGLIDSFHLVDLAMFVEESWGVRIDDTELNAATFDSVSQLANLIRQRQK